MKMETHLKKKKVISLLISYQNVQQLIALTAWMCYRVYVDALGVNPFDIQQMTNTGNIRKYKYYRHSALSRGRNWLIALLTRCFFLQGDI